MTVPAAAPPALIHRRPRAGVAPCVAVITLVVAAPLAVTGCPPGASGPNGACDTRRAVGDVADRWYVRAGGEYAAGDLGEAHDSIANATKLAPCDVESRVRTARIALARLDYAGAIKALENVAGADAAGLRARAFWYSDDYGHTAEEIGKALADPDFRDGWAKPVQFLSGQSAGRKPFMIRPESARVVELRMPRELGNALLIPIEIDGQATIAMAVTSAPEVILDKKGRSNPGWVNIKFGGDKNASHERAIDVRDVPAIVEDLSQFSPQQTVPIGAILGMNLLRRLHITIDRRADQFVLRREDPPEPPAFTKVPVSYVRAGRMVVRGTIRHAFEVTSGLLVDTMYPWSIALPDATWKKIGVSVTSLATYQGVAHGLLNDVRIGPLDVGPVEAVAGVTGLDARLAETEGAPRDPNAKDSNAIPLDHDIDVIGAVGAGFLSAFRVTLVDGGRTMWLETDAYTSQVLAPTLPAGGGTTTVGTASPAPKSSAPTAPASAAPKPAPAPASTPATTVTPKIPPPGAAKR